MRTQLSAICLLAVLAGSASAGELTPAEIAPTLPKPVPKQGFDQPRHLGGPDVVYEIPRQGCQDGQ